MKKFKMLSRAEMKNVLGGLVQPGHGDSPCATGETFYECVNEGACETSSGGACATSVQEAETKVIDTLKGQGVWGSDCYDNVWCGAY